MTYESPLAGIRVVEVADGWAVPLCTKLLADLGASVTKVETPGGDRLRGMGTPTQGAWSFALANDGKTCVPGERMTPGEFTTLAGGSDVVVVDSRAIEQTGWELPADAPGTILCRFSDFGTTGPWSGYMANELCLQAVTGVMATTGDAGGGPVRAGVDLSAAVGAMYGAIAVLAALVRTRGRADGRTLEISPTLEISLYDCLASTLTHYAARILAGQPTPGRIGNAGPNSAPWDMFEAADGQHVFVIAANDATFRRLARAMGRDALVDDPRFDSPQHRFAHREAMSRVVQEWVGLLARDEVVDRLRAEGVPVSPVADIAEVLKDEHAVSRGLVSGGTTPGADALRISLPLLNWVETAAGGGMSPGGSATGPVASSGPRPEASAAHEDAATGTQVPGRPLEGIRVLDVGSLTAGPLACGVLAHLGAEVIKVEPPGGEGGRIIPPMVEGESAYFHLTNAGKKSVCLDLTTDTGREAFLRLVSDSDALVENQSPGALERRGIGPSELLRVNPDLVHASVTGYGYQGTLGGLRAYDTVIQAATGIMSLTGTTDGGPLKAGISAADVLGALGGTVATLAGLCGVAAGHHRGGHLDVAMYDVCVWSTQTRWPEVLSGDDEPARLGNGHRLFSPYGVFPAADGQVTVACETDAEWVRFASLLEAGDGRLGGARLPDLTRAERVAKRDELHGLVAEFCASRQVAEVVDLLQRAKVSCSPVLEVEAALDAEHARARQVAVRVDRMDGAGTVDILRVPLPVNGAPGGHAPGAPSAGQHNREFGLDADGVAAPA